MTWVKVNGISVQLAPGATVADYGGEVAVATAKMIQFRETWGDDKYYSVFRTPTYTCQRVNGKDQVIMGPVVEVEPVYPDEKTIRINPDSGFVPAFHTFNGAKEFVGLTVCLSGSWGEPYLFLPCTQNDIWPFEYGQWNTEDGATRPQDYDGYMRWVGISGNEDLFEVPADHDYVAYETNQWVVISGGPTRTEIIPIGEDARWVKVWGTVTRDYERTFSLINDWDYWWNEFDLWKESAPRLDINWHDIWVRDYYQWNGQAYDPSHWAADPDGWVPVEIYEYSSLYTNSGLCPAWNKSWTTTKMTEANDIAAGFIFGLNYLDGWNQIISFTDQGTVESQEYNTTAADFVYVFGDIYLLRNVDHTFQAQGSVGADNPTYYHATDRIMKVNPRIYRVGTGNPIFAASFYRKDELKWEYVLFDNEISQYNDVNAMYDFVDDTTHTLPLTVGGEPTFGNGEFSMIYRDDQEFDITRPRGIYYDDPDRPLTEE